MVILTLLAVAWGAGPARADWPQFLGPHRNGISPETGLARRWPQEGPPTRWRVDLGPGFGGAAIVDGRVFVLDRVEISADALRVFDLESGKEIWTYGYDAPGRVDFDGSRSTPAVDASFVFIIGPFGHVHCIDRESRKKRWARHLIDDDDTEPPGYGFGQSPLLYRDTVIFMPLSRNVGVVAVEKASGRTRWQTGPIGDFGERQYTSPISVTLDGVAQVVVMARPYVVGLDADTGTELWRYDGYGCQVQIPTPTPCSANRLFLTGGYGAGSAMIRVHRAGGQIGVEPQFRLPQLGSIIPNALLIDGHLYANCNTKRERDGLVCIDLDGNVRWKTGEAPRLGWGNMIAADGLIYLVDSDTGTLHLIEADPSGYKPLASAALLSGESIWGPLALADGCLMIRDHSQMKCIDVRPAER